MGGFGPLVVRVHVLVWDSVLRYLQFIHVQDFIDFFFHVFVCFPFFGLVVLFVTDGGWEVQFLFQCVDNFILWNVIVFGFDRERNDFELIGQHEVIVDFVDIFEHFEVLLVDIFVVAHRQVGDSFGELFNETVCFVAIDFVEGDNLHTLWDACELPECCFARLRSLQLVPVESY